MPDEIIPTSEALEEALNLSAEILKDIELSRAPLRTAALKASRLASLLNHSEAQVIFNYEVNGYPTNPDGIPQDIWQLLIKAGRTYLEKDTTSKKTIELAFTESIEQLEQHIETCKIRMQAARDPDVSISSANPNQYVSGPIGNAIERQGLQMGIQTASQRLASRRAMIYQYTSRRHYELKFSGVAQNIFSQIRESVDRNIGQLVPEAIKKFASVHDNLHSTNPEDWANAVHSCRRILQGLSDALFPPQEKDGLTKSGKPIKLGPGNYINRLMCFVEAKSDSDRFVDLVGSHLSFLGDRLDAVFDATQKGSHKNISHEEANRYVVYAYMLIGDILSLYKPI